MSQILIDAIGAPCPYCSHPMIGRHYPTRDHIWPRSKGYTLEDPRNRAIVCEPCNEDKGSRTLASFAYRLRRGGDPRAPHVEVFIQQLAGIDPKTLPKRRRTPPIASGQFPLPDTAQQTGYQSAP